MAKLDELKDMFEAYAENYDDLKDAVNNFAKYRQSKEREQRKKTRENELIYSTVRGKYGDRDDARYNLPETELVASTIPTAEKWEGDAKDAITYAELEKLLRQEYAAQELAERVGENMVDDMYRSGVMFGDKKEKGPLFVDKEDYYGNAWDKEQRRRKNAEKEKSLRPAEIKEKKYPSKMEAFFFGYSPNEEEDGFLDKLGEGEIPSVKEAASEASYFVPVVGEVKYGANILDRIREGGMPGFVETAMAVPFFGPRAVKLGKSAYRAYKTAPSRRFAKEFRSKDYKTPMIGYEKKVFDDNGRELQRIDVYPWD